MNRYLITLTAANGSNIRRTMDADSEKNLRDKCISDYPLHSLTINGVVRL